MKIIYLINKISKTSVPVMWTEYINKKPLDINIDIITIKPLQLNCIQKIKSADIIHGHHIKAMGFYLLSNSVLKKKTIFTVHGSYLYLSNENKKILKYIFNKVDKIIFVNKFLYDILPKELQKIILNKYKIILNGIDLNFKYKRIDIYKKFNLDKNSIIIFHPARFVKEKNHLNFLDAFKKFHKYNTKAKLILAGDGKLRDEIETKIEKLNLKDNVTLLGTISKNDVYNFLLNCDLFIMPSISEGLNTAFLEAISMNSKILVSNIEQFSYIFKYYNINPQEYNTYFTNPNSIEDMLKVLIEALSNKKNKNLNKSFFSLERMTKEYKNVYQNLLLDKE